MDRRTLEQLHWMKWGRPSWLKHVGCIVPGTSLKVDDNLTNFLAVMVRPSSP